MKIYCPCDKSFDIEHSGTVNLDKNPELIAKIADGSFLTFKCPQCGRNIRSELKTRVEWQSKKIVLLFVPESDRIACLSSCAGLKQIDLVTNKEEKTSYVKPDETPVIGYAELAERIAVLQANLEPQAVEVLKFFLLDSRKDVNKKKLKLIFHSVESGSFEFYVHGLKTDEVAVIHVPCRLYDSILNDIKRKKKQEVFTAVYLGNYLSYQNILTDEQDE